MNIEIIPIIHSSIIALSTRLTTEICSCDGRYSDSFHFKRLPVFLNNASPRALCGFITLRRLWGERRRVPRQKTVAACLKL